MKNKEQSRIDILRTKWESEKNSPKEAEQAASDAFRKSHPEVLLKRFSLYLADGRNISVPYSAQPIIEAMKNKITIHGMGWRICISGRNLVEIDRALQEEQLQWVKEDLTGFDDPAQPMFVKKISIDGKLFE